MATPIEFRPSGGGGVDCSILLRVCAFSRHHAPQKLDVESGTILFFLPINCHFGRVNVILKLIRVFFVRLCTLLCISPSVA